MKTALKTALIVLIPVNLIFAAVNIFAYLHTGHSYSLFSATLSLVAAAACFITIWL
jgi:hypothetical protein